MSVRLRRADPEAIGALGGDKASNILDACVRRVSILHSSCIGRAGYPPVPFKGDKNLSPLMAAMVTAAAPEGAKAVRSVFRSVIVAALCVLVSFIQKLDIPNTYIQHRRGVLPNSSSHTS